MAGAMISSSTRMEVRAKSMASAGFICVRFQIGMFMMDW